MRIAICTDCRNIWRENRKRTTRTPGK